MLLTDNYRCVTKDGARTIKEAVYSNFEESRSVYDFVVDLCINLGASRGDLSEDDLQESRYRGLGST